jgi:hypothetical protein
MLGIGGKTHGAARPAEDTYLSSLVLFGFIRLGPLQLSCAVAQSRAGVSEARGPQWDRNNFLPGRITLRSSTVTSEARRTKNTKGQPSLSTIKH